MRRSPPPQPRHAQFPKELARVDDIGGIGGEREHQERGRGKRARPQRHQIGRYASAITTKLKTSSQKKAGANSQRPNTSFSQIAPVTMIV